MIQTENERRFKIGGENRKKNKKRNQKEKERIGSWKRG